jgi:hypothetical protein
VRGIDVVCDTAEEADELVRRGAQPGAAHGGLRTDQDSEGRVGQREGVAKSWQQADKIVKELSGLGVELARHTARAELAVERDKLLAKDRLDGVKIPTTKSGESAYKDEVAERAIANVIAKYSSKRRKRS